MGSQVMRGTKSQGAEKQVGLQPPPKRPTLTATPQVFIFSCWDADVAHKVGWTTPETCSRFGGEGTGSHCLLEVPATEGVRYKFRVASSGKNATGAMWTGILTETKSGKKLTVGTLFHPHLPGRVGFGDFKVRWPRPNST
jgi:hypothetical protein